ncbi:hypothetical protein [Burkholderia anthina]|uniref:hypothetical protein n=1 Tax=Burkholderia anthina TaxID=179879 RepID=UPI0037C16A21
MGISLVTFAFNVLLIGLIATGFFVFFLRFLLGFARDMARSQMRSSVVIPMFQQFFLDLRFVAQDAPRLWRLIREHCKNKK